MIFGKRKLIIICVYFQYDYYIVIDVYKFLFLLVALKVERITLNYKSITLRHVTVYFYFLLPNVFKCLI